MASQWRIRHKLMLGLGLVVGTIALLLGGTLRGLWSYYVTVNSIRFKVAELKPAEEFKAAIERLTSEDMLRKMQSTPDQIPVEIGKAREKLEVYEKHLKETLEHGHDPGNGLHEIGLIEDLNKFLDKFGASIDKLTGPQMTGFVESPDHKKAEAELQKQIKDLYRATLDLHDGIYTALGGRMDESRNHYQSALWITVPTSIVGLLLVTGLLRSFYAWVFFPIRDLEAGVGRVAKGDFAYRIEVHSGDEMEDLGAAFNDMTQRLQNLYGDLARQVNERSRQLVRSERLASVGFLAAGVAHEINNPLASIAFCSEALEARLGSLLRQAQASGRMSDDFEVFTKYLKMIQDEAFRCKNITERLLAFSRTGEPRKEAVDLRELVQSVLDVTQHLQNHRGKDMRFEVSAPPQARGRDEDEDHITAWVNGEEIKSVVLNLVVNALDSMDEGGRLTIRLRQRDGMAELQFTDTGCGMTQEVLDNIFEPFFTRSRTGKGTGLGLTISHRIITQHGGEIEASSPGPNLGSTFTVRLPIKPVDADAREEVRPPEVRRAA